MKAGIGIVVFMFAVGVALAGEPCCSSVKSDAKECGAAAMSNLVSKLALSVDQTAKVKEVCAKYSQAERTSATASNCMAEVQKILTPEQAAKFKAICQGESCPVKKAE